MCGLISSLWLWDFPSRFENSHSWYSVRMLGTIPSDSSRWFLSASASFFMYLSWLLHCQILERVLLQLSPLRHLVLQLPQSLEMPPSICLTSVVCLESLKVVRRDEWRVQLVYFSSLRIACCPRSLNLLFYVFCLLLLSLLFQARG